MKRILLALMLMLAICLSAAAQTAPKSDGGQEAINVANRLFEAMRAKNMEGIRVLFLPEGQLVTIDRPRTGEGLSQTRVFTADAFAKMIAEAKAPEFIEKMLSRRRKSSETWPSSTGATLSTSVVNSHTAERTLSISFAPPTAGR